MKELVCPKCDASTGIEFENNEDYITCQCCDYEDYAYEWKVEEND